MVNIAYLGKTNGRDGKEGTDNVAEECYEEATARVLSAT